MPPAWGPGRGKVPAAQADTVGPRERDYLGRKTKRATCFTSPFRW
jgi:hypothetical protein